MDQYFNANAILSLFCKNYMDLKKGLPIRPSEMGVLNIIPTDQALELVNWAKADLNGKLECLVNGLGQDGFEAQR